MKRKVLILLFLLNWAVIWANSALPADLSHTLSDWLVYGVETAFGGSAASEAASSGATSSEATASEETSSKPPAIVSHVSDTARQTLVSNEKTNSLRTAMRKTAHALEFLTFGVLAMLALAEGDLRRWALPAAVGLFTALGDETIQIFSKRTSSLKDVWLDLAGFAAGALLTAGCAAWARRRRARKSEPTAPSA